MNIKLGVATAIAVVTAAAGSAYAQERPAGARLTAPSEAVELTVGTGYTQGFGRLQRGSATVVGAGAVNDVASAGLGIEAGLGYRINPRWMIGGLMQYQEFSTGTKPAGAAHPMDASAGARGAVGSIDATFHISPYQTVDPWVRLGTGYRVLWEVHSDPAVTYTYHGFDWAKLAIGADVRLSRNVAIAPVIGADLNTFVWKVGAPSAAISDLGVSTFVYAGLQGRFDLAVSVDKYDRAVAQTQLTQAQLTRTTAALENTDDALKKTDAELDRERAKIAMMNTILAQASTEAANAEMRAAQYQELVQRLQKQIDAGDLKVTIRDGRMVLELPNDVLFASGHTDLTPPGKAALVAVADALAPLTARHFQVAGHTDNVPIHTARYASNWELSGGRAVRVVHFLIEKGVAPATLSAAGYADVDPVGDNATIEGRKHNRRTEITIQPNIEK